MTAPQFTPGPWHALDIGEIVPSDDDGFPLDETRVCFMATPGEGGDAAQERIDANARLIAAAPELYEALDPANVRKAAEILKGAGSTLWAGLLTMMADKQERALAKARGEQGQADADR